MKKIYNTLKISLLLLFVALTLHKLLILLGANSKYVLPKDTHMAISMVILTTP